MTALPIIAALALAHVALLAVALWALYTAPVAVIAAALLITWADQPSGWRR